MIFILYYNTLNFMNSFWSNIGTFMRLAFCENGRPSSKRVLAGFIIACVMFVTIWSCCVLGMTDNNKSIVETEMICATAMLGVSSVTRIWTKSFDYMDEYKEANSKVDDVEDYEE